jgi:hypothetical protein
MMKCKVLKRLTQREELAWQNGRSLRVCLDPDSYRGSLVTFFFQEKESNKATLTKI